MSKAKEIADERLARGEITVEEHEILVSRLSSPSQPASSEASSNAATQKSENEMPKGSYLWGIAGLVMCFISYNFGRGLADNIIMDCVNEGRGSFEFCRDNGVKWPFIYAIYTFSGLMLLYGGTMLLLPKK